MTGKFISIEGIEGAGKSTQLAFIQRYLTEQGKQLVVTREPGGTELGEQIRTLLLTPTTSGMASDTELLLMFAARAEHVEQIIKPALKRGDWVLSDRFVDATFAYQGGGRGIDLQRISTLSDWTLKGLKTDVTFLFDLPVEIGQQRVLSRNQGIDRFEQEKVDFFQRIRERYLKRAQQEPNRIKVIDASKSIVEIELQLTVLLDKLQTN
ncbi:MAG: dTMP kinase [Pseudomonadota bacterium]|nr:dTMP kinase [Pseudomonadota bacterium]MDO7710053.1 dTMP kinase [Pseudomonadota bacterium]